MIFSLIFVGKMCVFVSRSMKIATFLRKNGDFQNGLLIFFWKKTHSETKSWKSSRISTKKSYNNNGKPWKSSRLLRVRPNFFIFLSFFIIFLHFFVVFSSFFLIFPFFHFFHFFMFRFFFLFLFSSCFFIFLHFFVLFFFSGLLGIRFFVASIASRFLVSFPPKKQFGPSFPFFSRLNFLKMFPFSFLSDSFSLFFFIFSQEKSFFQICFTAGVSIRVQLFPA